jgi:2-keto-4-pentenoate hydratase/2-oxohepta-3-ene-1,7-dioic acid hydratase in catechol pathway
MKLLRYGPVGQELPGLLDAQGRIRALSPAIKDITPDILSPQGLAILKAIDPDKLPIVQGQPRLGTPISGARQFYAIGVNYAQHALEANMAIPKEPILFNKALTSLSGPNDDIVIPTGSESIDWEVELGFVVGQTAYQVPQEKALEYVAGYFTANDVSERDWQLTRGGQFVKGKSCPSFGPIGPWIVTSDEVPDPQNLKLHLELNGKTMQSSSTSDMLFSVAWIIAHITGFFRLEPGDLVVTGTPAGVGYGMNPRVYLKSGDVVTLEVQGLGSQTQKVVRHT